MLPERCPYMVDRSVSDLTLAAVIAGLMLLFSLSRQVLADLVGSGYLATVLAAVVVFAATFAAVRHLRAPA